MENNTLSVAVNCIMPHEEYHPLWLLAMPVISAVTFVAMTAERFRKRIRARSLTLDVGCELNTNRSDVAS